MAEAVATPFEVTLGDGSVVKAANVDEAFRIVAKMKEDTAAALRAERQQREQRDAELARLNGEVERLKNPPKPVENGKFNSQRYYELLNSDPDAANSYWFEAKFGVKPEAMVEDYQRTTQNVSNLVQQSVTASFLAQHAEDFPQAPETARVMRQRVEQLTGQGFPFTTDTLNYAYDQLVGEGAIKPNVKTDPDPQPTPNPSLSGAGGGPSDAEVSKAWDMPMEQLEDLIRTKGLVK